jgi:hypothetical protein
MILLKKPLLKRPKDWHKTALEETKRAIAHFRNKRRTRTNFKFEAYKQPALKVALYEIFHGKCAYCEVDYAASQPGDVEHFRPKARVREGNKANRTGYYWLAADWRNLLPSCRDCNCQRRYKFPNGRVVLRGKGDQFPLLNPKKRGKRPGGERYERPLLLNPSSGNSSSKKPVKDLISGKSDFGDAFNEAEKMGGDNRPLQRIKSFRRWLLEASTKKAVKQVPDKIKSELGYELRKIKTEVEKLLKVI